MAEGVLGLLLQASPSSWMPNSRATSTTLKERVMACEATSTWRSGACRRRPPSPLSHGLLHLAPPCSSHGDQGFHSLPRRPSVARGGLQGLAGLSRARRPWPLPLGRATLRRSRRATLSLNRERTSSARCLNKGAAHSHADVFWSRRRPATHDSHPSRPTHLSGKSETSFWTSFDVPPPQRSTSLHPTVSR